VAAGDVTHEGAVLWTRADETGAVRVQVALDDAFSLIVFEADDQAVQDADLTVRFDVGDLAPDTRYYYRFLNPNLKGDISEAGTFRTAPAPNQARGFSFVFSGDSDYSHAPFHLLADAADLQPDLFVYFGDTIYADVPAAGLGTARTLAEYHAKYLQNRGDRALRRLLSGTPLLVGWDDHEVADDYAGAAPGAQITQERIAAGYRAFFDYMPIRSASDPQDAFRTYRKIRYGSQAEFFLLDGRQYREASAEAACGGAPDPFDMLLGGRRPNTECLAALSEPRAYLGREQLEWLEDALASSTATHKFVVTDQPFSFIGLLPYDRWDGYDAERRELLEFIDANLINNVWLLSTDVHMNAFNQDVTSYFREHRPDYELPNAVAVREIVAGPIATNTLRSGALETAARVLGPFADLPLGASLLDSVFDSMMVRVARANRWAFWDANRFAYAVVEVSSSGEAQVRFRGYDPFLQGDQAPPIETLYDSSAPSFLPCWLVPGLGLALFILPIASVLRSGRVQREA
jgi:alkaline phosphatase D